MNKLFSPACERNAEPILAVLAPLLIDKKSVLEIGSGTGQHAVHFGARLPHLVWQCSDVRQNHASIIAWQQEAALANVLPPIELEIGRSDWPATPYDVVFTANTCHIMPWHAVEAMFAGVAGTLAVGNLFCIYGPFNYGGAYTSIGNEQFDASLKAQARHMGIRDIDQMRTLAEQVGMALEDDVAMPANNRFLVFRRM